MKNAIVLLLGISFAGSLWADDLTKALQQRLKDQGYFYGDVNGQPGEETTAAIRRYQIRNGLKVTGQLDDATLRSLHLTPESGNERPAPRREPTPPQEQGPAPGQDSDDDNYRQPPGGYERGPSPDSEDYRDPRPPWFVPPRVVMSLPVLFGGTIYEGAPGQVQENVLYAVQGELVRRRLFRGEIDGHPGPATTEAIVRLQVEEGLRVNGRLDNETLDDLEAFPGQRNGPPERGPGPWRRRGGAFFPN